MTLRIESSKKPRNWLSRREQAKMIFLVFLLGGVVFLMNRAGNPKSWQWFTSLGQGDPGDSGDSKARSPKADDAKDNAKIDTRLSGLSGGGAAEGVVTMRRPTAADRATVRRAVTVNQPPPRYFPGVDPNYFFSIRDNTMIQPGDTDAWFHLLHILKRTEQAKLERESTGHITFRQLYDQPDQYRGELITLAGKVRRCEIIKNSDTAFGLEGDYYRLWFWPRGVENPLVIYSLGIPKSFPLGQKLGETAEVTGFFFKVWAYKAKDSLRTAPLLLCKTIRWNESKVSADRIHLPPPKKIDDENQNQINDPREYMKKFWDLDESQFGKFADGRATDSPEAVAGGETSTLINLLSRLPSFPRGKLHRWRRDVDATLLSEFAKTYRGQIVPIDGRLEKIEPRTLSAEQQRLYDFDTYYRCQFKSALDDRPIVVYARHIPNAWKGSAAPGGAQVSTDGFFIKRGQRIGSLPSLVFATDRLAWHPDTALGNLGMDAGLLDTIDNRKEMTGGESECFYQMLSVSSHAQVNHLAREAIADQMRRQQADSSEAIRKLPNPSGSLIIRDLLSKTGSHRGRLVTLSGTALRVTPVLLGDALRRRYGYAQYYEVDVSVKLDPPLMIAKKVDDKTTKNVRKNEFTAVFCMRELPDGFPHGDSIREQVEIPAFFFKIWWTRSAMTLSRDRRLFQLTPLLIGPGMKWSPRQTEAQSQSQFFIGLISAGLFAVSVGGILVTMWYYRRGDKKFEQDTLSRQFVVEEGTSLNDLDIEAQDGPDFSHLE